MAWGAWLWRALAALTLPFLGPTWAWLGAAPPAPVALVAGPRPADAPAPWAWDGSAVPTAPGAAVSLDGPVTGGLPLVPVVVRGPAGAVRTKALLDTGAAVSMAKDAILRAVGAVPTAITQSVMGAVGPATAATRIYTGVSVVPQALPGADLVAPSDAVLRGGLNPGLPEGVVLGEDVLSRGS